MYIGLLAYGIFNNNNSIKGSVANVYNSCMGIAMILKLVPVLDEHLHMLLVVHHSIESAQRNVE